MRDIENTQAKELRNIRRLLERQVGVSVEQLSGSGPGRGGDVGVEVPPRRDIGIEVSPGGGAGPGGPIAESSPVFTTGEGGATITSQSFTSEGEFAFGFPSRVIYLRTEDAPIVAEFDSENNPVRQVPVPASKGEITLGDGGAGFRAEKVNVKLARNASVNETTVHIIAYR